MNESTHILYSAYIVSLLLYLVALVTIFICNQVMWFRTELAILDLDSDSVNGTTMNYLITDLLPVANYTVLIYAINRNGKGKGSDEQNISTHATGKPTPLLTNKLPHSLPLPPSLPPSLPASPSLTPSLPACLPLSPSSPSLSPTVPGLLYHLLLQQFTSSSVQIEYAISAETGGSQITHFRIILQAGNEPSNPPLIVAIDNALPLQFR